MYNKLYAASAVLLLILNTLLLYFQPPYFVIYGMLASLSIVAQSYMYDVVKKYSNILSVLNVDICKKVNSVITDVVSLDQHVIDNMNNNITWEYVRDNKHRDEILTMALLRNLMHTAMFKDVLIKVKEELNSILSLYVIKKIWYTDFVADEDKVIEAKEQFEAERKELFDKLAQHVEGNK